MVLPQSRKCEKKKDRKEENEKSKVGLQSLFLKTQRFQGKIRYRTERNREISENMKST